MEGERDGVGCEMLWFVSVRLKLMRYGRDGSEIEAYDMILFITICLPPLIRFPAISLIATTPSTDLIEVRRR